MYAKRTKNNIAGRHNRYNHGFLFMSWRSVGFKLLFTDLFSLTFVLADNVFTAKPPPLIFFCFVNITIPHKSSDFNFVNFYFYLFFHNLRFFLKKTKLIFIYLCNLQSYLCILDIYTVKCYTNWCYTN